MTYGYVSNDTNETAALGLSSVLAEGTVLDFAAMRSFGADGQLDPQGVFRKQHRVAAGALVLHEQAAGGEYGDPLKRSRGQIRADLEDGKISCDSAERT
ncbi:hypothetical protein [Mesorhizobium sp. CN2-181]|uniref:hypothetical protein n=1 Tax=Mesorhizobium yinganensis TaxID=3157707 RepID=UPI0032B80CED